MVSKLGFDTPIQLYNSILADDREEQWYRQIRGVLQILSEDQRPPTITFLWRRQRSCNWDHSTAAAQLQMHRGTTRQQGIIKLKVNLQVNNQNFMYL